MPGFCFKDRRRRCHGPVEAGQEEPVMNGRHRARRGAGRGGGVGPSGRGKGRQGGPYAAGPTGVCVCPHCGYRETHERGVPCGEQSCPKCDVPLSRENVQF
jgi:hypothetical protein